MRLVVAAPKPSRAKTFSVATRRISIVSSARAWRGARRGAVLAGRGMGRPKSSRGLPSSGFPTVSARSETEFRPPRARGVMRLEGALMTRKLSPIAMLLAACATDEVAAPDAAAPPAPADGFQLSLEFTAPPGVETWKCQIGTLPFDGFEYIDHVTHEQNDAVHHMDVTLLLKTQLGLPPGMYDCAPLYAAHPELMEETILYAAQTPHGDIQLPPNTAAAVPGGLTYMHEVHYVNTSEEPVAVYSHIQARAMPSDDVLQTIWGFAVRDRNLTIPP